MKRNYYKTLSECDQLIKAEHYEKGIWYFTTTYQAGKYLNTPPSNVKGCLKGWFKQLKGWTFEYVPNDGTILLQYINPEPEQ